MRFSTKAITTCAVLAALALALSYLESFFPPLLPLPGVKLGLANIVTVYALYALGASSALAILVVRCLLGSLFAGNASALLFSLLGGLAAMLVMIALHALPRLSVYGVSVGARGGAQLRTGRRRDAHRSARPRRSPICRSCWSCRCSPAR